MKQGDWFSAEIGGTHCIGQLQLENETWYLCQNKEERFYKIGRTFNNINKRFNSVYTMPYNFKIVKIFIAEAKDVCNLEVKLKNQNKNNKYTPKLFFAGTGECFNKLENYE